MASQKRRAVSTSSPASSAACRREYRSPPPSMPRACRSTVLSGTLSSTDRLSSSCRLSSICRLSTPESPFSLRSTASPPNPSSVSSPFTSCNCVTYLPCFVPSITHYTARRRPASRVVDERRPSSGGSEQIGAAEKRAETEEAGACAPRAHDNRSWLRLSRPPRLSAAFQPKDSKSAQRFQELRS